MTHEPKCVCFAWFFHSRCACMHSSLALQFFYAYLFISIIFIWLRKRHKPACSLVFSVFWCFSFCSRTTTHFEWIALYWIRMRNKSAFKRVMATATFTQERGWAWVPQIATYVLNRPAFSDDVVLPPYSSQQQVFLPFFNAPKIKQRIRLISPSPLRSSDDVNAWTASHSCVFQRRSFFPSVQKRSNFNENASLNFFLRKTPCWWAFSFVSFIPLFIFPSFVFFRPRVVWCCLFGAKLPDVFVTPCWNMPYFALTEFCFGKMFPSEWNWPSDIWKAFGRFPVAGIRLELLVHARWLQEKRGRGKRSNE